MTRVSTVRPLMSFIRPRVPRQTKIQQSNFSFAGRRHFENDDYSFMYTANKGHYS